MSIFVFLVIMIIQSMFLTFPGNILMIYTGFKFGLLFGTLINYLGLYLSCLIGFRVGLWSSGNPEKYVNEKMRKFHNWMQNQGLRIVLLNRILPILPNNFISIGSGIAQISERKHAFFSTFLILQAFMWSFIGSFLHPFLGDMHLELSIYHGLILFIFVIIILTVRHFLTSEVEK